MNEDPASAGRETAAGTVIVGIGNCYRRDDGVGVAVARRLRSWHDEHVRVMIADADPQELMTAWEGAGAAILVDATLSGREPGSVRRFDASVETLPVDFFRAVSTHVIDLAATIEMARTLGRLPRTFIVYGIEAATFDYGEGLSAPVAAAVDEVVQQIIAEVTAGRGVAGT